MTYKTILLSAACTFSLALSGCKKAEDDSAATLPMTTTTPAAATPDIEDEKPTLQTAKAFLEQAEIEIEELNGFASRAYWVNANFVTEDTSYLAAKAGEQGALLSTRLANEAKRFDDLDLPEDFRRKLDGLKRGSNFPAPDKPGMAKKLSGIMTSLDNSYASGTFEYDGEELSLGDMTDIMAESRDPEELQAIWEGWRTVSPAMLGDYSEMVDIINDGSKELGYPDTGALWRAGYDMDPDDFAQEADRLWNEVKPLYDQLHCYVRAELNEEYGDDVAPLNGPIRADILGNMWGQSWGNIYDIVQPANSAPGVDTTKLLLENDYDAIKMVETAEGFFTSLGFDELPDTFWERSLITKPRDRVVQCHASAWDIDDEEDIRIKMCTKVTGEDFVTVHHELGHNIYQRAYRNQPVFYKTGANDGFHEAIGDMVALSITPDYYVKIGLLDESDIPGEDADTALLMRQALDKIAFLPFGLMVDQWRWKVFNGEYAPADYNDGWWELREKYQGLKPPASRPDNAFDPGAKYHIPGNTPYMRYFLSHILQFQFHKAACDIAGFEGPLHRCSIYGNKDVGKKFDAMLKLGASQPWPDALEAFTGQREMSGQPLIEYFEPLMGYLEAENEGRACGW